MWETDWDELRKHPGYRPVPRGWPRPISGRASRSIPMIFSASGPSWTTREARTRSWSPFDIDLTAIDDDKTTNVEEIDLTDGAPKSFHPLP